MRGFLTFLLFLSLASCLGQKQSKADSLKHLLRNSKQVDELEILSQILSNELNLDSVIFYSYRFIELCKDSKDDERLASGYSTLASSLYRKGDLDKSLEYYLLSLEKSKDPQQTAINNADIGSVYQNNQDFDNAFLYYRKAIKGFTELQDSLRLGTTYISFGYAFYLVDKLDSSAYYLQKATDIYTRSHIEYKDYYWSYAAGNLALVKAKQGEINESEQTLDTAIAILEKYGDAYAISEYKIELARIYRAKGDDVRAMQLAISGVNLAKDNGYKKFIRDGSELLSSLYLANRDYKKAYEYQSDFIAYNDSLVNADLVRKLANQRTQFEVGQKQAEVDLLTAEKRTQRIITLAIGAFAIILIVLAVIIYAYYRSKARINKILAEQKEELERLNSTKDKFFSIISHDLRSPVAGFHGISQMIKMMVQTKQTDQLLEMTEHIDSSVDQLSKLLDNLLNWAMQQQGHIPNVPEKVSLKEMTNDLVQVLSNMAKGKSIILTADIPTDIELWADKNSTMTILRNLVNNALKFTPEGGEVGIKAFKENDMARIEVYDTGVGIPKEKLSKLFQLQDKKSTYGTSGEKGLGLGLQLVHEFVEMNHGRIKVKSEEGKGTTFIIWLPLYETEKYGVVA